MTTPGEGGWKEVDRLVSEQKFEAASEATAKIRAAARAAGDEATETNALIREVQLRTGLHGFETAVRFLKDEPWPKGALSHATLNLFYAQALVNYEQGYSWEIDQREKVDTKGVVDLKAWTKDQIFAEAARAYVAVWKDREALGREPVWKLAEYVQTNDYPKGVRPTLRDAVSYLFVELLANTRGWRPEQSNDLFRLDLPKLIAGDLKATSSLDLADASLHPLVRIGAVLDDLEAWHAGAGEKEAALEARLERLRRLHASFTESHDRAAIRKDLESRLGSFREVPWWSVGKADLAEFVRETDEPGHLVRARKIADEGWKAYPDSIGGQRCRNIVKTIEQPSYELLSMSVDAPGKRSVMVTHKNLAKVHFRAYRFDVEKYLETSNDYNLLPQGDELKKIVTGGKPEASWSIDLPATPDFEVHRTFVTPPLKASGTFLLVCSARADFGSGDNRVRAAFFFVSDLVLVTKQGGAIEVLTLSGETGEALAGVDVTLWRYDWQRRHERIETKTSDAKGSVRFGVTSDRTQHNHFLLAKKGDELILDTGYLSFWQPQKPGEFTAALVYTDRSIYRPLQKIDWKVVTYKGVPGKYAVLPSTPTTVTLYDGNNQVVDTKQATTNAFGSASGEFSIPSGRVLGNWRIWCSSNGQAAVRVEEYKRPTFETRLLDPKSALRLNRPATLTGEVKYYFGLPVVNGDVKWRVTRAPIYPWWWSWWGWGSQQAGAQTIATGTAKLSPDGTFDFTFTPLADERQKSADVTYAYTVAVDVTDEGGETRSATRAFRLGLVAVEARVEIGAGFAREGRPAEAKLTRTDLDGVPRPGKGTWRLVVLNQPESTVLPADEPRETGPEANGGPGFRTQGDEVRARWETDSSLERTLHRWIAGPEVARGAALHDAKGEAKAALGSLDSGAYRLAYETTDDFGAPYKTSKDFLVVGRKPKLNVPAVLLLESTSVTMGDVARVFVHSGLAGQVLYYDVYRDGEIAERRRFVAGRDPSLLEIPITEKERGGFGVALTVLRDHQVQQLSQSVFVPRDDKELKVEFATFRDKLRPGGKETFRVVVKSNDGKALQAGTAELLAYMYDKSLDVFAPHNPPSVGSLYPYRAGVGQLRASLGVAQAQWLDYGDFESPTGYPSLSPDRLKFFDAYGIGGPGARRFGAVGGAMGVTRAMKAAPAAAPAPVMEAEGKVRSQAMAFDQAARDDKLAKKEADNGVAQAGNAESPAAPQQLRSNFAETAFWSPHLSTESDGSAVVEFTVPDSVTAWNVWVHALTRDLRGGAAHKETKSVKDLMVRPYVPRFLRESDAAEIKVVVNNASDKELSGRLVFEILDPETNASLLREFGLSPESAAKVFKVKAGGGTNLTFAITAPKRVGMVAFKVTATAGDLGDGELRPVPLLPSRIHLTQSRFVTLRNKDRKTLRFDDLAKNDDPSLVNEQMVVTVDAQLFYTVLQALPYLVNYPYECTEQTLNRFVSTGIVSRLYKDYPAIAKMAAEFAKRETPLEAWDAADPNRKMGLEETPWLEVAKGGKDAGFGLTNVLDPRIAKADRDASLAKLRKAQTANGAFPWFPGGPPSPYMTLYILHGFAKAVEFGVDVPQDMVQRAWQYVALHYREDWKRCMANDGCWEFVTFLNYVASCYPDPSWSANALTDAERKEILDFSFEHWKQHSPYLKGYLALTLKRMGRMNDAKLVWASVMDSAKSNEEQGTYWAPEDRSWLWYNDTIETHAFALRTVMELTPSEPKKDGLVQWLLLNKKLNQWKSTRATAEVIYSLIHYLKGEGALGIAEDATVTVGAQRVQFRFEADAYTGKKNQIVIPGEKVDPKTTSTVVVEKESKGFAFASATWSFSTEKLPSEARGDFFNVSRKYFKRENDGREWTLKPLAEGTTLKPGDQVEVHISLRTKHEAEYVHLRDPRAAGLEPENAVSRYKWDLGIFWYEETRDSGSNFFFERLPVGEYTFKYRLRANMAGTFRIGPATVQSMYAPEFNAYSSGFVMKVAGE